MNKNQTVIYDVFDLASAPEARLAIISITNTFDFTSRVLDSRIQSRIVSYFSRIVYAVYAVYTVQISNSFRAPIDW